MKVELNGREIDISGVFPLKVRDWKAMEQEGISLGGGKSPITEAAGIVYYALHKRDPSVTREEVDELELGHPAWKAVMDAMRQSEGLDAPLSRSSTSSAASSGGPSET